METIKTAVVVVLLLAVLYGVFVVLNKPDLTPPPEAAGWNGETEAMLDVELGAPGTTDGLRSLASDHPAGQSGQPTLAPMLADAPANLPQSPPGDMTPRISDAVEAEITVPPVDQPTTAGPPSDTQLASANVDDDDVRRLAPTVVDTPPATAVPSPAAETQGSIYAQTSNLASRGQADFRSIRAFDNAWNSATAQLQKGQWAEALLTLSFFFHDPDINGEERQRLLDLLDPLAGKVIYSSEHTLEAPYEVRPGDRLDAIAQQCQVPLALLQNINGIAHPDAIQPGTQLKVLRGPFRAEIDLKRSELVLFLGKYYAGRFAVSVGNDPTPQPTECQVLAKQAGREYVGQNGIRIPARTPGNPYGDIYLDLGNGICVHGSPDTIPAQAGVGCVSLSDDDVADVASILSIGSRVIIR